ncbi:MAG: ATP-binding protein, partial [Myxococcota bacterium]
KSADDANLQEIESLLSQASRQAHSLAQGSFVQLLEENGLSSALSEAGMALAEAYRKPLHIDVDPDLDTLPPAVAQHIYRAGQEAISNALRHANARTITVRGRLVEGLAELVVEDDGDGFDLDAVASGLGLAGIQARASLAHGSFEIDSEVGKGTRLRFALPVATDTEERRAV